MPITDYQSKYLAYELTKRCASDSVEKLAGAQVGFNPHQLDAALFAFQSPLSKGAILADEVGLGKTIEAGLVISQKWAERKRRILIITPANLRKQWHQEMSEKFFLPCEILESKSYNAAVRKGQIKEKDRLIKEARRAAATVLTLEDKLASQKQIKNVEAQRNEKRRSLFEAHDAMDQQREDLIGTIEGKLQQGTTLNPLFSVRRILK